MLAIGLMSGTSLDGVDCVLVDIDGVDESTRVELREFITYPMPDATKARILEAVAPGGGDSRLLCSLHAELGHLSHVRSPRCAKRPGLRPVMSRSLPAMVRRFGTSRVHRAITRMAAAFMPERCSWAMPPRSPSTIHPRGV